PHPMGLTQMPDRVLPKLHTPIVDTDDNILVSETLNPVNDEATPGSRIRDLDKFMNRIHIDTEVPRSDEALQDKRDHLDLTRNTSDPNTVWVGNNRSSPNDRRHSSSATYILVHGPLKKERVFATGKATSTDSELAALR